MIRGPAPGRREAVKGGPGYRRLCPAGWDDMAELLTSDEARYFADTDLYVIGPPMCDRVQRLESRRNGPTRAGRSISSAARSTMWKTASLAVPVRVLALCGQCIAGEATAGNLTLADAHHVVLAHRAGRLPNTRSAVVEGRQLRDEEREFFGDVHPDEELLDDIGLPVSVREDDVDNLAYAAQP